VERDGGCRRRGHKVRGGNCLVVVAPEGVLEEEGMSGAGSGVHAVPQNLPCRALGDCTLPSHPCALDWLGGNWGNPAAATSIRSIRSIRRLLFSSHPTAGPRWGETFVSLHWLPYAADTTDCYGNPGDVEQGDAAWLGGSRSGRGSHRRGDVARLDTFAGVSPCTEAEDKRWLVLPIPLTPQQV